VNASISIDRGALARRGQRLEYVTIAWNTLETLAALISGLLGDSVALVGFGLDSLIEVISGAALLWRLHHDADERHRAATERIAQRIVGNCFIVLALYITFDSLRSLISREGPEYCIGGIVVAVAALVAMPLLARAKRDVARQFASGPFTPMQSRPTFACFWRPLSSAAWRLISGWAGGGPIRSQASLRCRSSRAKAGPHCKGKHALTVAAIKQS
jgi:hypothetical protein